jgi:hypothetical protein
MMAPSPEGGRLSRGAGNRDTAGPDPNELGLARLGAAGPERAQWSRTQVEATRNEGRRKSDEQQQQGRGTEKTKKTKLER